jgi:DNA-binding XRE family transcriptional regulator
MSKENAKFWASGDSNEVGDLLMMVRTGYLKQTPVELANNIGSKPDTIEKSEQGKNAHGFSLLKKTCEKFDLKLEILISKK